MEARPVNAADVHSVWHLVEPHLARVIPKSQGDISLDAVKLSLLNGTWLLIVLVDEALNIHGAGVFSISNQLNERVAHGVCLGGKAITDKNSVESMKDLMRSYGATVIEASVGDGMKRLWERHGFVHKYHIMKLKL